MPRPIPPERLPLLIEAATRTFIARGYRLTQMADIADALGVAKGTLYGYVESKEALFDAAVRYADGHVALPALGALPLPTPPARATVAYIRARIEAEAKDMTLLRVCTGELVIKGAARELEAVALDLYRRLARNRLAVKLVDRCATEYPELAEVWFGQGRSAQHQLLVELLTTRAKKRRLRRVESPEIAARAVLEQLAYWAVHRHFDPAPQHVDDATIERTVIDLVVHAFLEEA